MPHVTDPGLFALRGAIRAAIVVPATFAFAHFVIGDAQTELFAAFGSIALAIMVDFSGPRRVRLLAYSVLALVGAVLIALGTLCSARPGIAAAAMLVVGLAILLGGVVNGYLAAATTAALLTFILPVMVPADAAEIPARLAGWGLACAIGVPALLLVWPARPPSALRAGAAGVCRALADLLLSPGPEAADAAREALAGLRRRFLETPYRPTGPTGATGALAALIEELGWLVGVVVDRPFTAGASERATAAAALRGCADQLEHGGPGPDPAALRAALERDATGLREQLADPALCADDEALRCALRAGFEGRLLCQLTLRVIELVGVARGGAAPGDERPLGDAGRLLETHVSLSSVWLRNSLRGAVGLALAVLIAQELSVQHAFWVVLGSLSVLRSSALSTGSTVLRALAGTAVGIVVGGLLVVALGNNPVLLWIALPFAVGLGAYAPRAVSFAAGQAAFTIVVLVLFNLIDPVGWEVGLVRIEDVSIGFAVSLGVGLLFWPHGAIGALREAIAAGYTHGSAHVAAAFERLFTGCPAEPARELEALGAEQRLDAAFRQALAERGARLAVVPAARLVAGAQRLRLAAQALDVLSGRVEGVGRPPPAAALVADAQELRGWYEAFAAGFAARTGPPVVRDRGVAGEAVAVEVVRDAAGSGDETAIRVALAVAWGDGYLLSLGRMRELVAEADELVVAAAASSRPRRARRAP